MTHPLQTYDELVSSRREWLDSILIPWCQLACRKDLLLAETEWPDLAGRPAPEMTLWKWAWERFPVLAGSGTHMLEETYEVVVTCQDGRTGQGFPDGERSQAGLLVLVDSEGQMSGPFTIDEIRHVVRLDGPI